MKLKSKTNWLRLVMGLILAASLLAVYQPAAAQTAPNTGTAGGSNGTNRTAPSTNRAAPEPVDSNAADPRTPSMPAPVLAAEAELARILGITTASVAVVSYTRVEWRDSCLELPRSGEGCLTVITPGYLVVLSANGARYVAHTDLTGENIRWAPIL